MTVGGIFHLSRLLEEYGYTVHTFYDCGYIKVVMPYGEKRQPLRADIWAIQSDDSTGPKHLLSLVEELNKCSVVWPDLTINQTRSSPPLPKTLWIQFLASRFIQETATRYARSRRSKLEQKAKNSPLIRTMVEASTNEPGFDRIHGRAHAQTALVQAWMSEERVSWINRYQALLAEVAASKEATLVFSCADLHHTAELSLPLATHQQEEQAESGALLLLAEYLEYKKRMENFWKFYQSRSGGARPNDQSRPQYFHDAIDKTNELIDQGEIDPDIWPQDLSHLVAVLRLLHQGSLVDPEDCTIALGVLKALGLSLSTPER